MERIVGAVVGACIAAVLFSGAYVWSTHAPIPDDFRFVPYVIWGILVAGLLGWCLIRPAIVFRHASYRVDDQGIEIRGGALWRSTVNVPRSRVQHTDVTQGPLERRYGLGSLAIHTAGVAHARVVLAGIAHARALALRDALLPHDRPDVV